MFTSLAPSASQPQPTTLEDWLGGTVCLSKVEVCKANLDERTTLDFNKTF